MQPSPSFGPPWLSASPSPTPLPCGIHPVPDGVVGGGVECVVVGGGVECVVGGGAEWVVVGGGVECVVVGGGVECVVVAFVVVAGVTVVADLWAFLCCLALWWGLTGFFAVVVVVGVVSGLAAVVELEDAPQAASTSARQVAGTAISARLAIRILDIA